MVDVDGSYGEGGGQILRTSLALSALTGRPVRIRNVRAERKNPGLAPQHLTAVRAVAAICDAQVEGAELGSTEVTFRPGRAPAAGDYRFDVAEAAQGGSAGSATLILQTVLLPLARARGSSRIEILGGTHVAWSPPFEYLHEVYLPTLRRMGLHAECELERPGFYPAGGGRLSLEVRPTEDLEPLSLETRGELEEIRGVALACNLPSHIPQRMADRAASFMGHLTAPIRMKPRRETSDGPGAGIFLAALYRDAPAGFSVLGRPGKPSEEVAEEACRLLLEHHEGGRPVDPHLGDQLLLPAALADGTTVLRVARITGHLTTNAHVIRRVLPVEISIEGEEGRPGRVTVEGGGWPT